MEATKRLVIYTAMTRGYDELQQPEEPSPDIDYLCFSNDIPDKQIGVWKVLPIPFETDDRVSLVRFPKLLPEKVLEKYGFSLWVDSNITVTREIQSRALECMSQGVPFAGLPHSIRHYVMDEAIICLRCGFGNPRDIVRQMRFLISNKYPDDHGLIECCIIFRNHSDPLVKSFDNLWWKLFCDYSKRDQLGCDFALWKTGLPFTIFADPSILSRCQRRHVNKPVRYFSFLGQCNRRFYLAQALLLYMKHKFQTTLCP